MGNKFWCGFISAVSISGYMQDRHGSMGAYIEHLQAHPEEWTQVPAWIWFGIGVAAVLIGATVPDRAAHIRRN